MTPPEGVKDGHEIRVFSPGIRGNWQEGGFGRILCCIALRPAPPAPRPLPRPTARPRRRTVGLVACTTAGLAYGGLLAWLASAAGGYAGDSESLSLVLLFMAGFPVSLPLCGFDAYFLALAPPIFWLSFGAAVSFGAAGGRAMRFGRPLLFVHYLGVLLGLLAVPWAVESSAHVSAKGIAGVALGFVAYVGGQLAWWRALGVLDRLAEGTPLPRLALSSPELGKLAAGVIALLAAGVMLHERAQVTITCRRLSGQCDIERVGWGAFKRQVPVEDVAVRFGVPWSRLEIGAESRRETLISVACSDRFVRAGGMFNRCESRGGKLLAELDAFLNRLGPAEVSVVDQDPWRGGAVAGVLGAVGLWLLVSSLVRVRARRTLPPPRSVPPPPRTVPPPTFQRANRGR